MQLEHCTLRMRLICQVLPCIGCVGIMRTIENNLLYVFLLCVSTKERLTCLSWNEGEIVKIAVASITLRYPEQSFCFCRVDGGLTGVNNINIDCFT